ncbi:hypothetical protein EH240_31245 [Mesorhizobium tamadayense]|uniref:Uncharacterized protein n=1 Tax=Mesorhizobium tamadayense TaxID=425306 RepID=A0A3P3F0Q7_9HYPH|nr:hypothetical protein [Mesorhizobium tamadayense]RRH92175.1 hypothetical protein EH240_31245 [Mesorhizobium tamadayense]
MDYERSIRINDQAYELTSFAKKYGLSLPIADAVLFARGPSRTVCDSAALAFLFAIATYARKQPAR